MDIYNFVIANHHINLVRLIKDQHMRHYIWEIAKVLIPVFLTGMITFIIMRTIDNRNKKRWLNEGYLKRKVELEIALRQVLLNIKRQLDLLPDLKKIKEIKDNLNKDYLDELNQINYTFGEIQKEIHKYTKLGNMSIPTENPSDEYNLGYLMDEYMIFVKNQNIFSSYTKLYNQFLKTPAFESKVASDKSGNCATIGISSKDIESNDFIKIEILISTIYLFKEQTDIIVNMLEKNFKTGKI